MKRYSRIMLGTLAVLILLLFQNCAGSSFQTTDLSGNYSVSSTGDPSTSTTMPGTPTTIPTATTLPPVACPASSFGVPTMSAASATTAVVLSGQGAKGGRSDSSAITFSYTASNTPAQCSQSVTVNCKMTSKASDMTVIDQSGARVAFSGNASNAFVCKRAKTVLDATGSSSIVFQAGDNDTDTQCLSGTATFELSLQSNGDTNKKSSPAVITVTYKSNCFLEQLDGSAKDAYDQLGTAVSIDGDTMAAIAPGDDGANNDIQKVGAVYMYQRNTAAANSWTMSQIVRTTDSSIVSDRGVDGDSPSAVALKGNIMVIGTEFNNANAGAVHIFKRSGTTWSQASKIQGPVAGGKFGKSVAIAGTTIVIGAPAENNSAGAVYLYDANTFAQIARINNPLASGANTYFGAAVAIEGSLIAVGAPGSTLYRDTVTGDVFLFQTSGAEISTPFRTNASKTSMAMKNVSNAATTVTIPLASEFGNSVSIYNGVIMVGAPGFAAGGKKVGAAFVIGTDHSTIQYLTDFSGTDGSRFGTSVSMGSGGAVVGASEVRNRGGAVDVFTGSGLPYAFGRRVFSHSGADGDQFGFSVSMSGNFFVSGAKLNSEPNNSSGTVSLFSTIVP